MHFSNLYDYNDNLKIYSVETWNSPNYVPNKNSSFYIFLDYSRVNFTCEYQVDPDTYFSCVC